jgi:hypothetical protein
MSLPAYNVARSLYVVDVRQSDCHQNDIGSRCNSQRDGCTSADSFGGDFVAALRQRVDQILPRRLMIVDDEHPSHPCALLRYPLRFRSDRPAHEFGEKSLAIVLQRWSITLRVRAYLIRHYVRRLGEIF